MRDFLWSGWCSFCWICDDYEGIFVWWFPWVLIHVIVSV